MAFACLSGHRPKKKREKGRAVASQVMFRKRRWIGDVHPCIWLDAQTSSYVLCTAGGNLRKTPCTDIVLGHTYQLADEQGGTGSPRASASGSNQADNKAFPALGKWMANFGVQRS